jgi:hypothetical protein
VNKKAIILVSVVLLALAGVFAYQSDGSPTLVVYKSPDCGCCKEWVKHMEEAGFEVEVHDVEDMNSVKQQQGVNGSLASCHTAVIDGYVIEGHVPAEDVARLLAERPAILGLSVPGMVVGSPGMEQGSPANYDAYDVLTFDGTGATSVYHSVAAGSTTKL